jgi:hypothetical protein
MKNKQLTNTYTRFAQLELKQNGILDAKERRVQLSFSSDMPYQRNSFFDEPWIEILGHDPHEANISRFNNGAPLLRNHNEGIGVVEKAWLENGKGNAIVRLSKRTALDDMWKDIEDGIISNVSVGYRIKEKQLIKAGVNSPDEYRVTSWEGLEISILDVPPADATVGIGRSDEAFFKRYEEQNMDVKPQESGATIETPPIATGDQSQRTMPDEAAIRTRVLAEQAQRNEQIKALFAIMKNHNGLGDLKERCLADPNITLELARQFILEELGNRSVFINNSYSPTQTGETEQEKFTKGVENALLGRAGIEAFDPQNEFNGRSLLWLAERSLQLNGRNIVGYNQNNLINMAMQRSGAHSSSDFPILLENVARKSMMKGYGETTEIYENFVTTGNLPDFKPSTLIATGETDELVEIKENGEIKHTTFGESKEQIALATFGRGFSVTRKALINDDLNQITTVPQKLGRAAKRTIAQKWFDVLNANPTMGDGITLFHANHKNLAASGAAVSITTLDAAKLAMRKQKGLDDKGTVLNIRPTLLLVPASKETSAQTLIASAFDPSATNPNTPNPFTNWVQVFSDARLDDVSSTAWYLFADPNQYDVCQVAYLNGNSNPTLEQKSDWTLDGIEWRIWIDAGIKFLDHRTVYKNAGA